MDAAAWNRLVPPNDPFLEHAFLVALEESGSLGDRTGWYPQHLLAYAAPESAKGPAADQLSTPELCGALPLYLKTNSYGEYIFDWAWAEAAHRAGIAYYPKLVSALPFTPVGGARLLFAPDSDSRALTSILVEGAQSLTVAAQASSLHILFSSADEVHDLAERHGFLERLSYQFHWTNRDTNSAPYDSFDHFLATFRHNARKQVRRDRKRAQESGLHFETLSGAALNDAQWQALYHFYRTTISEKWGVDYLTQRFFELVRERLADRLVVTLASKGKQPVAGALSFRKGKHLYGRYWGCVEEYDSLHFELCYYRPIEYCIATGLEKFEAGAQGTHKLKRGLLPCPTYSAHWIRHPGLREAITHALHHEHALTVEEMNALERHSPFR